MKLEGDAEGRENLMVMDMRPLRAYRRISEQLSELERAEMRADEDARFRLAQSASRFSQRTQHVVDGTMSLSAALMRAGEVDEAQRLLQEVQRDVATEEAALIETVNEVKVRGEISRSRITRLKLMKMIAAATMGASLFVFSAFGVAVAGFLDDESAGPGSFAERNLGHQALRSDHTLEKVTIAGVRVELTRSELLLYGKLTRGLVDNERLGRFLLSVLPFDLAREVQAAIEAGDQVITTAAGAADRARVMVDQMILQVKETSDSTTKAQASDSDPVEEGSEEDPGPQPNEGGGEIEDPEEDDDDLETLPVPVDNPLGG